MKNDPDGQILSITTTQISYLFRGSAVRQKLIQPNGPPLPPLLDDDSVYIRTVKGFVYRAVWRSMAEAAAVLGDSFFAIHQSLLVNF